MLRRLDIDRDGTVTLAEIERHQQKRFALMDRNGNGRLERHERHQMQGPRHKEGRHAHRGPQGRHGPDKDQHQHRPAPANPKLDNHKMEL